jgi:hypothetical protein
MKFNLFNRTYTSRFYRSTSWFKFKPFIYFGGDYNEVSFGYWILDLWIEENEKEI